MLQSYTHLLCLSLHAFNSLLLLPYMATHRQCGCSSVSPFTQLAKAFSFSSSLAALMTFMYLISLLLFAFPSLVHSHTTEPSSYSSVATSSSQIYTLHEQEEPSITKPFIYETVAASLSAGSFLMHADFPQKKEALILLDDGQDPASKEEAPVSTPAFIYESVAALFSSRLPAEGSHQHDNVLSQDAEAALLDDGGKHRPSIAMPSFIHESVAASLAQKAHGSTLMHESAPQEENTFLLNDGNIGKPIMHRKEVAPSYIYESVIAASIPLRPPSDGSTLRDNVPQEENAIFIDDGTVDPIIAKPSFIYESVAASINPEAHDANRNNVPQEEHGFLLDDGGKHVDTVEKGAKPITGKPFIYENVAAQFHIADHEAGGSRLHDSISQQENSSLLDDDGKHVHESQPAAAVASTQDGGKLLQDNVSQEKYVFLRDAGRKKPISSTHHDDNNFKGLLIDTKSKEVKSQSLHDIDVKKSLNVQENKSPAKAPPSLLHDNVPQGKHAFLVDDGGIKHVEYDSPVASSKEVDVQFAKEEEHVLHDNASQGEYSSLVHDGGSRKELHSSKLLKDKDDNTKNHKKLAIYHKLLRMVVGDSSRNMQIKNGNEEILRAVEEDSSNKMMDEELHPMIAAGIGDPMKGNLRMVVSDSSNNMTHKGAVVSDKEGSRSNEENLRMAVGDSTINMIEKESRVRDSKGNSDEENMRIVVGDSSSKMVHKGDRVEGNPSNEESLRMVVGDSSNNMILTGYKVQGNAANEENLRMVVGDSSKSMVQEGSEDNLRMVVDDTSNNMVKKGPFGARGRLRLCTSLPIICLKQAHAAHMNHIALYGLPPTPIPETNPACCGGVCVDLNTDQLNCGSCGQPCALLQTCCNGNCIDLNTDNLNCGQCGNPCPPLSPCQFGMCGYY